MQPSTVTIVVPTRNRLAFLGEAIESIQRQTYQDWDLVIVDDASDDGSADDLGRAVVDDDRIRLIRLRKRSERSAARNMGLAHARGRYVMFLDDDDRLTPSALARLISALERQREASVAIGARVVFDPRGHTRRAPHPRIRIKRRLTRELLLGWVTEWVAVPGQCLMRTDVVRMVGGWNGTLVGPEDQELLLRLTARHPAVLLGQPVLEYRLHDLQWRPPDVREQEDAFRHEFAQRESSEGVEDALAVLRAGQLLREADKYYDQHEYRETLPLLIRAAREAPSILRSPIILPPFAHLCAKSLVGALLGERGSSGVAAARDSIRQRMHRAPEARITVLDRPDDVPGRGGGYVSTSVEPRAPRLTP